MAARSSSGVIGSISVRGGGSATNARFPDDVEVAHPIPAMLDDTERAHRADEGMARIGRIIPPQGGQGYVGDFEPACPLPIDYLHLRMHRS